MVTHWFPNIVHVSSEGKAGKRKTDVTLEGPVSGNLCCSLSRLTSLFLDRNDAIFRYFAASTSVTCTSSLRIIQNCWTIRGRYNKSVSIATGLDGRGIQFYSRRRQEIFVSTTVSWPAFGFSQPPFQHVPGGFPGGKCGCSLKLTSHPHLVPTLKIHGAIPPLPH